MIANCQPPTSRPTMTRPAWLVMPALAIVAVAAAMAMTAVVARPVLTGATSGHALFAFIADGVVALAMWHVLHRLGIAYAGAWALAVLALPGIALDMGSSAPAALLSAAAAMLAVSSAAERRHRAMLGWAGVAAMLSLTALLLCPFVAAMLIARRTRWRIWLFALGIALLVTAGTIVGNWHGDPSAATSLLAPDYTNGVFRDAPNIWALASITLGKATPPLFGLAVASAIGAIASYLAWIGATGAWFRGEQVVSAALLALMLTAGLLPGMGVNDFLAVQILALALAAIDPRWRSIRLVVMTQIGACAAIWGHVGDVPLLTAMGALPMIAAMLDLGTRLIRPAANDNPLLARAV